MRFIFVDKEKIGVFQDGKTSFYESTYILNYKENAKRMQKSREWKKKSEIMLEEGYYFGSEGEPIHAQIHGACLTAQENKIAYVCSVNDISRICYKYLDDEKKTEAHLISSMDVDFLSFTINKDGDIVGSIQTGAESADIALYSRDGGDYKLITSGDSLDENPFIDKDGRVFFNSYGVGRDAYNEFVAYAPSEIFKYDLQTMDIQTVLSDEKYSFVKPMTDKEGNLYCICKPGTEQKRENIFLQILLIPVRIIEAIIGFFSAFVTIFAGKPMVSGGNAGGAKRSGKDRREVFINNQLVNVDKEIKRNKKSQDGGFIPKEWKLLKFAPKKDDFESGYELVEELASGVADYTLAEENGEDVVLYTNGQKIFSLSQKDGKRVKTKLVHTDFCLKISALYGGAGDDPFGGLW